MLAGGLVIADFIYSILHWQVRIRNHPVSASIPLQLLLWPTCLDFLIIVSYCGVHF